MTIIRIKKDVYNDSSEPHLNPDYNILQMMKCSSDRCTIYILLPVHLDLFSRVQCVYIKHTNIEDQKINLSLFFMLAESLYL